jgi:hypothetical protein
VTVAVMLYTLFLSPVLRDENAVAFNGSVGELKGGIGRYNTGVLA